jgi:wyosine [tRNA(Phe)-imidazoG37] synthetase (radical SAM superfamily)
MGISMTALPLKPGIIYGPVDSRRLGRSLGINLLPCGYKLCSFDCLYCHYGRTAVKSLRPAAAQFPAVEAVLSAVGAALRSRLDIDFLTFSGNGEPTLHPRFGEIVAGVRRLRDEINPAVKLAILSNSTTVHLHPVREALEHLDVPILKLDAGDPVTFARINRPVPGLDLNRMIEGLGQLPRLVVQCVLIGGSKSNIDQAALEALLAALGRIRPSQVQIYSTDRPVAESGVECVPRVLLQGLASEAEKRVGAPVRAYWAGA